MRRPTRDILGYAGLIPFIVLSVYIAFYSSTGISILFFSSYSALISSFIAGTLWGQALHINSVNRSALFILSNFLSLAAWFSVLLILLNHTVLGVCLLLIINVVLWMVEKHLLWKVLEFELLDRLHHYWRLRGNLTFIVVSAHIVTILSLTSKA
tara:strand:- start:331 stop:792 length:462 start_codon:yes stop_codon:yes gene_type:complete